MLSLETMLVFEELFGELNEAVENCDENEIFELVAKIHKLRRLDEAEYQFYLELSRPSVRRLLEV